MPWRVIRFPRKKSGKKPLEIKVAVPAGLVKTLRQAEKRLAQGVEFKELSGLERYALAVKDCFDSGGLAKRFKDEWPDSEIRRKLLERHGSRIKLFINKWSEGKRFTLQIERGELVINAEKGLSEEATRLAEALEPKATFIRHEELWHELMSELVYRSGRLDKLIKEFRELRRGFLERFNKERERLS